MTAPIYLPSSNFDAWAAAMRQRESTDIQPANIDLVKVNLQEVLGVRGRQYQRRHLAGWVK